MPDEDGRLGLVITRHTAMSRFARDTPKANRLRQEFTGKGYTLHKGERNLHG